MNQNNVDVRAIVDELAIFDKIVFNSEKHTYVIDGAPSNVYSVTRLVNSFKPVFDVDKWASIKAKKEGITLEEMKFIWQEKALFSTTLGTCVHEIIESVYTGANLIQNTRQTLLDTLGQDTYYKFKPALEKLVNNFKHFFEKTNQQLTPIKNELVVGDITETRICGTLDFLAVNNDSKKIELYDFKTNNNISFLNTYNEVFLSPLSHLQVCEFNTYSLQLSMYRYIIEKYTNIKIDKSYVLWLNSPDVHYQLIETTYLKDEIEAMLQCKGIIKSLLQTTNNL